MDSVLTEAGGTKAARAAAEALHAQGFRPVSNKYHVVARVPPGRSLQQAFIDAGDQRSDLVQWLALLGEPQAADHFRRVYASGADRIDDVPRAVYERLKLLANSASR